MGVANQFYVWLSVNGGSNTDPAYSGLQQYTFITSSANATVGAVYSNNGIDFTVNSTITAGTTLTCDGSGPPLAFGTLTKVSGTGDATITYSKFTFSGFTPGIEVAINSSDSANTVANKVSAAITAIFPLLVLSIVDNVLSIASVTVSTEADAGPSTPGTLGPYIFDTSQSFTVGGASTTLTAIVNGETSRVMQVASSDGFPNSLGYLILNYGCANQEGPIPYVAVPSSGTILISPAYFVQQNHAIGESVLFVTQKAPITLSNVGADYQGYLTDTASGRVYAQNLIDTVAAAGITVIYTILFPNPVGLGGWESIIPGANEVAYVYGP